MPRSDDKSSKSMINNMATMQTRHLLINKHLSAILPIIPALFDSKRKLNQFQYSVGIACCIRMQSSTAYFEKQGEMGTDTKINTPWWRQRAVSMVRHI